MGMLRLGFSSTVVPRARGAISSSSSSSSSSSRIRCVSMSLSTHKPSLHISTDSGNKTRKVVEAVQSEIKASELALERNRGIPTFLPFTIKDDPRYSHIMLKRDFYEEKIHVTVNPVHDDFKEEEEEEEDEEEEEEEDDDDEDGSGSSWIPSESVVINVSIFREKMGTLDIGAYFSANKIVLHRMSFTEPDQHHTSARYYMEGDGFLQSALTHFLKARGIESVSVGFLYNYMIEKRNDWGTPGRKPTIDDFNNLKKYFEDW